MLSFLGMKPQTDVVQENIAATCQGLRGDNFRVGVPRGSEVMFLSPPGSVYGPLRCQMDAFRDEVLKRFAREKIAAMRQGLRGANLKVEAPGAQK